MTTVHLGLSQLRGALPKYATRFDLLELRPVDTPLARTSKLRTWRKEVPPAFVFSIVLPSVVSLLKATPEAEAALRTSLEVAAATEARCIVIQTPTDVTPTELSRRRLAELCAKLPRDVVNVVWEPRGLWEPAEAIETARKIGIGTVFDATVQALPRGAILYTRIRGIQRMSQGAFDRARTAFAGRREVFAILETEAPMRVAEALRQPLAIKGGLRAGAGTVVRPIVARLSAEDEEQE